MISAPTVLANLAHGWGSSLGAAVIAVAAGVFAVAGVTVLLPAVIGAAAARLTVAWGAVGVSSAAGMSVAVPLVVGANAFAHMTTALLAVAGVTAAGTTPALLSQGGLVPVLIAVASALVVTPAPRSRRRFRQLFGCPAVLPGRSVPAGVVAGAVGVLLAAWWGVGPGVAAVLAAGTVWVRSRAAARQRVSTAERRTLTAALAAVVAELRAGAHPSTAAQSAAAEAEGSTARVFEVSAARSRLGGSAAEGLRDPHAVVAAELSRVADAWQLAERHGLPLADLLAIVRADLVSRMRFHARTAAALAGARASAAVLAGLPVLGLALGEAMDAGPIRVLTGTAAGAVILPLGVALICAGLLWTDLITRGSLS